MPNQSASNVAGNALLGVAIIPAVIATGIVIKARHGYKGAKAVNGLKAKAQAVKAGMSASPFGTGSSYRSSK